MTNKETLTIELGEGSLKKQEVGNKAFNLGKLIQGNFPVPKGFVIKTNAYEYFLMSNNLIEIIQKSLELINYDNIESVNNYGEIIRNSIVKATIPNNLVDEIKVKYTEISSRNIAIRSSATAEDLPEASFAGQYDTFLNLKNLDQIFYYIKQCYASLWTNRAIIYRYNNKIRQNKVKIALIIQSMIQAKSAGILFTINPITSNNSEFLIESNFGLGESIVSGKSSPDQFFVQKLKRGTFKILSRQIANKESAAYPKISEDEEGIDYSLLSDDLNQQPSLSDDEIIKLAKIGLDIEKNFKSVPQDIEWAIDEDDMIYVLQTRPVTALKVENKQFKILWSRGYSDDYWNDNVTPLFFELLGAPITKIVNIELNDIMGYKKMDTQLLKLYNAHVYFNLNVIKKKIENEIPKFMRNEDVLNYFPEGSGAYGKKTMKELPFHLIKRIVAELRVMSYDPNGSMSKTAKAYEDWNQKVFIPYCKEFDTKLQNFTSSGELKDFMDLAEELDRMMITHFRLIRYGIPVHNIGMNLLVQYLLTRFLGMKACSQYYPILVSGLKHKLTETNDQIYYLASIINSAPKLKSIFINQNSENIYKILISKEDLEIKNFLVEFKKFLIDYGDRGYSREAYYPRWREFPMINIMDVLKSLVNDKWIDLEKIKTKNIQKRDKIEKIVESKIKQQRFGLLKWKFFSIILKNSKKYIKFREDQRFNLDKWITRNRNLFLEVGKILAQKEVISDESKIFFLYKQEIKNIILNKYNQEAIHTISPTIKERYEEFKQYENKVPSKFLRGAIEFNDILKYNKQTKIFRGLAASQGFITAPIRIVLDIDLISTVRAGEILVVARTDPGWTPVFSKIGGLITETGGILSHGAVVSREFGIPAVTNIMNACEIFKNGQIVELNGYNGTVILQKNP
ncbi:MAG: PEP/pyruvate-binding domain-containing protein [Candidatus Odinarchaeota archaeon]